MVLVDDSGNTLLDDSGNTLLEPGGVFLLPFYDQSGPSASMPPAPWILFSASPVGALITAGPPGPGQNLTDDSGNTLLDDSGNTLALSLGPSLLPFFDQSYAVRAGTADAIPIRSFDVLPRLGAPSLSKFIQNDGPPRTDTWFSSMRFEILSGMAVLPPVIASGGGTFYNVGVLVQLPRVSGKGGN